ncbi:MAG TPA: hypothetical protein DEB52_11825, partial [Hyphomonas sp.]|nr:hypothetical protein [Hyphomonas sp.]
MLALSSRWKPFVRFVIELPEEKVSHGNSKKGEETIIRPVGKPLFGNIQTRRTIGVYVSIWRSWNALTQNFYDRQPVWIVAGKVDANRETIDGL